MASKFKTGVGVQALCFASLEDDLSRQFYFFQRFLNSKFPLYVMRTESQPSTGAIFPLMNFQSAKGEGALSG